MPSRLMIVAILAFWLGMTALLIQREVVPMMVADVSPTYQLDLTDEIGARVAIGWHIKRDGERIGSATSRIIAKEDRGYEFHSTFHFDKTLSGIQQIESSDRINEDGKLQALSIKLTHERGLFEIRGEVVNQTMEPQLFDGAGNKLFQGGKIDMTQQGPVINPMTLVGRLRNLHDKQSWKITKLDPVSAVIKGASEPTFLIATVSSGKFIWNEREVSCYKIEYHETGKDVRAHTWVRKLDGMVLQQSAHLGLEMTLERMP